MHYVEDGMVLGIGTGTTVAQFIEVLIQRKTQLKGAVSSSRNTSVALEAARIPELDLNSEGEIGVYIDGADQATLKGQLIKGGGAALTREKVIAAVSRQFVCIIDDTKVVETLGSFPLPVESRTHGALVCRSRTRQAWRAASVERGNHHRQWQRHPRRTPLESCRTGRR